MKYMVVVNQKYMISLEHDGSCGGAEHVILDNYQGIEGCQAFDQEGMKTDTFMEYLTTCETISLDELKTLSDEYEKRWKGTAQLKETMRSLEAEVERLRNQLDIASYNLKIAKDNYDMSITNAKTFQKFVLGMKDC